MTDEQVEMLCGAIRGALSFANADALAHTLGPCKEDFSLAAGVHRVADSISAVANALDRVADEIRDAKDGGRP